uniref:Uncharacterized protein n=1 Tax=Gloeothece verrucosa (strain PCC 7822) TaxID=497965 RepID=E0U9Y9_GLOV7|nr:hypothetical protein Cyan7822_3104 [Gloeothece verrucosa PCC 7822]
MNNYKSSLTKIFLTYLIIITINIILYSESGSAAISLYSSIHLDFLPPWLLSILSIFSIFTLSYTSFLTLPAAIILLILKQWEIAVGIILAELTVPFLFFLFCLYNIK